jgi:hypothetical protein
MALKGPVRRVQKTSPSTTPSGIHRIWVDVGPDGQEIPHAQVRAPSPSGVHRGMWIDMSESEAEEILVRNGEVLGRGGGAPWWGKLLERAFSHSDTVCYLTLSLAIVTLCLLVLHMKGIIGSK